MNTYRRVFLEGMLLIHQQEEQEQKKQQKKQTRLSLIPSLYQQEGLTQTEIAQKLNVNQVTISRDIKLLGLEKKQRFRRHPCHNSNSNNNNYYYIKEERPARYQNFRYCKNCKWIPIAKVISKECNGIDYSYCPNCSTKMRKNAKKSKLNHKRREFKRL